MPKLTLTSPAFKDGDTIPKNYTCIGENIIPPLEITGVSEKAKTLVIIMDNPDFLGGSRIHWVLFNIPKDISFIEEDSEPPGRGGKNSWNNTGYEGPCASKDSNLHKYIFRLYSLDMSLNFKETPTKKEIDLAMLGHILQKTELVCLYGEKNKK